MSRAQTVEVPNALTSTALSAVNRAAGVHGSLLRFATAARLEAIPDEIDAAIAQLRALKAGVGDLRKAAGLPRNKPKPKTTTQGETQ